MEYRLEHDSLGEVKVPKDRYWGAVTQRAYEHFQIGQEKMPRVLIRALAAIKKAAAQCNESLGVLDAERAQRIEEVCDEILDGKLDDHFPLPIWQTGSGTQTNMNMNEVIANRSNQVYGDQLLHPNDHVNRSQSSNDVFPTAMHVACLMTWHQGLRASLVAMIDQLHVLEQAYQDQIKSGRTHLQDATPIRFSQEVSGWSASLSQDLEMLDQLSDFVSEIALGGTAVGTGLNAPQGYDQKVAALLGQVVGIPLRTATNKFHSLSSKGELVAFHGGLKALAGDLMKMANDIRWLASGPRCGLGEITIPANEPGSSIMPGKVNPTQCEALTMVALQVMSNDLAVGMAHSQGNFQLNVFMPVTIYNVIQSMELLQDGMLMFTKYCLKGLKVNEDQMQANMDRSLMLVTALSPRLGYEKAAQVAKHAYQTDLSLKEACLDLGYLDAATFDQLVDPSKMV